MRREVRAVQARARGEKEEQPIEPPVSKAIQKIDTAEARERTGQMIASELALWEAKAVAARSADVLERACAEARARVLEDTPSNRSLLRQTAAASTALNRAITGLQKAMKGRAQEAEKVECANRAKADRKPPLGAAAGASYVNIDGQYFGVSPMGDGQILMTPMNRKGPGGTVYDGVVCDAVEIDPDEGV